MLTKDTVLSLLLEVGPPDLRHWSNAGVKEVPSPFSCFKY